MSSPVEAMNRASNRDAVDHSRRALLLLWLALAFYLMATGLGLGWDRRWHLAHVFNSFYSPPHLFIYAMLALTVATVGGIMLWPATRREFGEGTIRIPMVRREIPAALAVCGAGLGIVMLAGLFDDIWHSNFGLDETAWSLPHAMLGTGFELTFIGILACRLALAGRRPISGLGWWLLGALLLLFSVERIAGPLSQASPDMVRGIAAFPVLAVQAPFQHTMRIYQQWNLNRSNWVFVPASALATGMALSLVWNFRRRRWVLLTTALFALVIALPGDFGSARYFGLQHDARNWLPVPVLPAALGFVVARTFGAGERWCWIAAGAVFG
ncbi:MAG TPA: hypothetical protein VGR61_09245, partial [Candidatus Dormibacteraeota bacterium]|nr:hypothetical protein [Candidatus Dormibacteraeota bacterium]